MYTGIPRSYEIAFPWGPAVGLCLGPYDGPEGGAGGLMSEVLLYWSVSPPLSLSSHSCVHIDLEPHSRHRKEMQLEI